ncbi:RAI1-domain-containing protein [Punctularia strigosozonata HHB-11173 SS5]|uniref:RAI1-domain-containing protein n=1 Tax=Punctularia strigosozonata (strain HHB-11173) TaxID=741275 RepID=UPI0004416A11|nr:RAI1-domain-containing protein [Punctularia strigosozonata HHB-11173 SS5]EIN09873.1 RAI1-domain-containing protein [Punctularia strigosozonata HHB-11173 SS5]
MSKRPRSPSGKPENKPVRLPTLDASHLPFTSSERTTPPKNVPFQQPLPLTTFSYTPSRSLEFTNSALKYYIEPPRNANLNYGYDRWIRRPAEKGRIDALLKAWDKVRSEGRPVGDIGVISWRGVMTKILTAPYEERDSWALNVMSVNGTLYFEEHLTQAKLEDNNNMAPRQRMFTYYGYAFESWCTSPDPPTPDTQGRWGGDVDTNVQWCSVVKTKLGNTRLVIGGEVDCVRGTYQDTNESLVELKTSMNIRNAQDEARFEQKLLKFYFQSFLLGVPEIVVGFRTPSGHLTTTQSFRTLNLPRLVRGKPKAWDPAVCLEWADKFLGWVKRNIVEDESVTSSEPQEAADPSGKANEETLQQEEEKGTKRSIDAVPPDSQVRVYRVTFNPKDGASMRLLDDDGVAEVQGGDEPGGVHAVDRVGFLPKWFWEKEVQKKVHGRPPRSTLLENDLLDRERLRSPATSSEALGHAAGKPELAGWRI